MRKVARRNGEATPVNDFRLERYEDGLGGVRYRRGVLLLGPSRGAIGLALSGVVFAGLLIAAGIALGVIFFAGVGAAIAVPTAPYLRSRVVATDRRMDVVNKWRRYQIARADVVHVKVEEFRPALGFMPFSGPTTVWPRTLAACYLTLRDRGVVRCDALVGFLPQDAFGHPSPVEAKAAILQRWIEAAQD